MFTLKKYTGKFKITAYELVLKDYLKITTVAEKLGIHPVMLYRWINEYQDLEEEAFAGRGNRHKKDAELFKMQKEIEDFRIENEILKKQRHTLRNTQKKNNIRKKELKDYAISKVCRLLHISRSGYYKKIKEPREEKTERGKEVIHCFQKHKRNYGRIRIRKELQKIGIQIAQAEF